MPYVNKSQMDIIDEIRKFERALRALEKRHGLTGSAVLQELMDFPDHFTTRTLPDGELQILKRQSDVMAANATHEFREVNGIYKWYPKARR